MINSINNNTQTYASLITEFFNRTNEKELQELGLTKKMILNKITKIIETLKKKSDNKTGAQNSWEGARVFRQKKQEI